MAAETAEVDICEAIGIQCYSMKVKLVGANSHTVIRINHVGRMANYMLQLMFVHSLQRTCRWPIVAEGFDLTDWGLAGERSVLSSDHGVSVYSSLTRLNYVARLIEVFKPRVVSLDWVILRIGNFFPPTDYLDIFPLSDASCFNIPDDRLLIHVRAGDVSTFTHQNYGPLPISYYQYLIDKTGLLPIFIGEIAPSSYIEALHKLWPDAQFVGGASALSDFQTMRRAKHIAISVSTFSWLAAYLSNAASIHVPIAGLLDPETRSDIDLLPVKDGRYKFYHIPLAVWERRYEELFPSTSAFAVVPNQRILHLKRDAAYRTFPNSAKIHAKLAYSFARNKR